MLWTLLLELRRDDAASSSWMVRRRYEIAVREAAREDVALAEALLERRSEGVS